MMLMKIYIHNVYTVAQVTDEEHYQTTLVFLLVMLDDVSVWATVTCAQENGVTKLVVKFVKVVAIVVVAVQQQQEKKEAKESSDIIEGVVVLRVVGERAAVVRVVTAAAVTLRADCRVKSSVQ